MSRRSSGVNSKPNVRCRRQSALERLLEIPEESRNSFQIAEIEILQSRISGDDRVGYAIKKKKRAKGISSNPNAEEEKETFDFRWGVFSVSTVKRSRSQRVAKSAGSGRKNNKKKISKKKKEYKQTLLSGGLYDPAKISSKSLREKYYGKGFVIKAVRK